MMLMKQIIKAIVRLDLAAEAFLAIGPENGCCFFMVIACMIAQFCFLNDHSLAANDAAFIYQFC